MTNQNEDALVGGEPTADEIEEVEWARKTIRKGAGVVIKCHRQLVTLNSVLLAGLAAFLSQSAVPKYLSGTAALCLLMSLGCSLYGTLPREIQVCPYAPDEIRRAREIGTAGRLFWLKCAALAFFAGLMAIAFGLFV